MKKLLLLMIGIVLLPAYGLHADDTAPASHSARIVCPDDDSLTVIKPNGENVITIKRTAVHGAYTLSVGGFDLLLGGKGYNEFYSETTTVTTKSCGCGCNKVGCGCSYKCACGCGSHTCKCGRASSSTIRYTSSSVKKAKVKRKGAGVDFQFGFLGFDGHPTFDNEFDMDGYAGSMALDHGRSISIGLNFWSARALNDSRTVWFSAGIRPQWNNYVFREDITLGRDNGQIVAVPLDRAYSKSKLGVFSVDIPLSWQFRIAQIVTLETGIYGGIRIGDRTKYKFPKHKDKGYWRTNLWQAGATASLRVKPLPFGIFANYSFTPLLENGAGPRVQPYTIGIQF